MLWLACGVITSSRGFQAQLVLYDTTISDMRARRVFQGAPDMKARAQ